MTRIPISFDHQGTFYNGYFAEVAGAGGNTRHLMINKYYCRQILNTLSTRMCFTSQTDKFEELNDYFVEVLIAWCQ